MKKLALIGLVILGLASCTEPTTHEIGKEDKIPNVVYQALDDTTQKPKYVVIETGEEIYLINKTVDKKIAIEKYIDKESDPSSAAALVIFILIILFILFICIS